MKSTTPIRDLTAIARAGLSGSWGKSIGLLLTYTVLIAVVGQIPFIGPVLQFIFAAPLVVGFHCYFLATIRKRENPFGLLFEGLNRFVTSWCAYMLVLLIMLAWTLPFGAIMAVLAAFVHPDPSVFPSYTEAALLAIAVLSMLGFLILLQMRYYLVLYSVADDPSIRAREAVRRSVELMRGNYGRLCLLWLRFIGWQLLAVLTLGIGFLWVSVYLSAATAAFYDDLSANG